MTIIDVPFLQAFKRPMLDGRKTCTTRSKKYGEVGDIFGAWGLDFVLTEVARIPLHAVRDHHWEAEGVNSPTAFVKVWENIHPKKGFEPNAKKWLHRFVRVE